MKFPYSQKIPRFTRKPMERIPPLPHVSALIIMACMLVRIEASFVCTNGNEYSFGSGGCVPCSMNYYSNSNTGYVCISCPRGTTTFASGFSYCDCPIGHYFTGNGVGACVTCPDGSSSLASTTSAMVTSCTACSQGYTSNSITGNLCQVCSAGTYNDGVTGQADCYSCPSGTSNTGVGNTYCTCAAGYYFNLSSMCVACEDGTTSTASTTASKVISCSSCSDGQQSSSSTAHLCVACGPGTYSISTSTAGLTSCTACPTGTSNSGSGNTYCTCAAGKYFSSLGGSCVACPDGSISAASTTISELTLCTPCAQGTYNDVTLGHVTCASCPVGTSNSGTGNTFCTCNAGNYFGTSGTCVTCPDGTTSAASTTVSPITSCAACTPGEESNSATSHQCVLCAINTYNTVALGLASCVTCPAGTYNTGTGNTFCTCDAGNYFDATGACVACPVRASSAASTTAAPVTVCDCPTGQVLNSGLCMYTSGCDALCADLCTAQSDSNACFGGCQASAAEVSLGGGVYSCFCGEGTVYYQTSCVPVIKEGCYDLCGTSGCILVQNQSACLSCGNGTNVVSTASASGTYTCSCRSGTHLVDGVCGLPSTDCDFRCADCTAENSSSACIACAVGFVELATDGENVTCGCAAGTLLYAANGTCLILINSTSECYPLCENGVCLEAGNSSMCVGGCKNGTHVVQTSSAGGDVFECGCEKGTSLDSEGECIITGCDELCKECSDVNTCAKCSDKEGTMLSEGRCICETGYVMATEGGEAKCIERQQTVSSAIKYTGYVP